MKRCAWAEGSDAERAYHDEEWGQVVVDDRQLFEMLVLESAQAGLSWSTILNKREGYREAFDNFDAKKIAVYGEEKRRELLGNPGIVRNRLKIDSTISNARLFLEIQREYGSFSEYIWAFVGGKPIQNKRRTMADVPATSEVSDAMSKALKKRGFKFVGSTICYAYMQATGMVNDHVMDCFCYQR